MEHIWWWNATVLLGLKSLFCTFSNLFILYSEGGRKGGSELKACYYTLYNEEDIIIILHFSQSQALSGGEKIFMEQKESECLLIQLALESWLSFQFNYQETTENVVAYTNLKCRI